LFDFTVNATVEAKKADIIGFAAGFGDLQKDKKAMGMEAIAGNSKSRVFGMNSDRKLE